MCFIPGVLIKLQNITRHLSLSGKKLSKTENSLSRWKTLRLKQANNQQYSKKNILNNIQRKNILNNMQRKNILNNMHRNILNDFYGLQRWHEYRTCATTKDMLHRMQCIIWFATWEQKRTIICKQGYKRVFNRFPRWEMRGGGEYTKNCVFFAKMSNNISAGHMAGHQDKS